MGQLDMDKVASGFVTCDTQQTIHDLTTMVGGLPKCNVRAVCNRTDNTWLVKCLTFVDRSGCKLFVGRSASASIIKTQRGAGKTYRSLDAVVNDLGRIIKNPAGILISTVLH